MTLAQKRSWEIINHYKDIATGYTLATSNIFRITIKQSTSLYRFISSKIIGSMKRTGCVNMKYLTSVPSSYFTSIDVLAIQN